MSLILKNLCLREVKKPFHSGVGFAVVSNADRHCTLITHDSFEQRRNAIVGQSHQFCSVPKGNTHYQVGGSPLSCGGVRSPWERCWGQIITPRWRPAPAVRYRGLLRCDALGIKLPI